MEPDSHLGFLEELRGIAQMGLAYAHDHHDRERYTRLLALASERYSHLCDASPMEIQKRLAEDIGHVTPKVGVNGAVFSASGKLLLVRRADDRKWSLPGGWVDINEGPRDALSRELREEVGIVAETGPCIEVFSRLPGAFGQPYTSCQILFHAISEDEPRADIDEVLECGYFDPNMEAEWHKDHGRMVSAAYSWWCRNNL